MFSPPDPKPGLPFDLAAALNADPATAKGLEERLREMGAITPQAVANEWDSAEDFAKEVGIFQGVARRLWKNMEAVCTRRVSALADASPPHHAGNPMSRTEWTGVTWRHRSAAHHRPRGGECGWPRSRHAMRRRHSAVCRR